jgi:hypothetical protein
MSNCVAVVEEHRSSSRHNRNNSKINKEVIFRQKFETIKTHVNNNIGVSSVSTNKTHSHHNVSATADSHDIIKHATWEDYEKSTIPRINWRIDVDNPRGKLCIRKWNSAKQHLGHMHIGKAGGTFFDVTLVNSLRSANIRFKATSVSNIDTFVENLIHRDVRVNVFFCERHNDMHFINQYIDNTYPNITFDHTYTKQLIPQLSLMGFIRNPVERYVCTILIIKLLITYL